MPLGKWNILHIRSKPTTKYCRKRMQRVKPYIRRPISCRRRDASSGIPKNTAIHLRLIELMMVDEVPARIAATPTMRDAFELLRSYPSIGDFLAYQFVTDLNYSEVTDYSEMDFVVPGPGALDGISKCFSDLGGLNEAELIREVAERQDEEFDRRGTAVPRPLGKEPSTH